MGRAKGKGKKQSALREDTRSGEEEKIPVKRRGRPLKPLKEEIKEEKKEVVEIEDEEDSSGIENENGRKRKKPLQVSENGENGVSTETNTNELIKSVGFRQIGSRRKNKPRRAAEAGVKCR